ncbi:MAG TPA: P1 family peptidase [Gemmatimonadales bacterium]|nr:P1 family peptidase [Gemmatimonadales bacterium]
MTTRASSNLATVPGITVGHWTHPSGRTGCTVVLGPKGGMRAAAARRGRATGTRELDALDPRHLVGHADALLLTGGSAYGLGAADGVMAWLRARGRGFPVREGLVVPIVPAAVIFDLGAGMPDQVWPGPDGAAAACDAAAVEIAEGSVGVGAGATIGKAAGIVRAMKSGLGTWAARGGEVVVGALVVVNAVGDVRDEHGSIIAGARSDTGGFLDAQRYLAEGGAMFGGGEAPRSHNTTLGVVVTNAALTKIELEGLAGAAADALARCITPFATAFDGDIVFAASTAAVPPASPLHAEALAALAVPEAVRRAVRLARGVPGLPGLADPPSRS